MKKNVGRLDALMRITFGLTGVAWGTARMVRHPNRSGPLTVTLLSAMKVAEGVTRFCPMLYMMGLSSATKSNQLKKFSYRGQEAPDEQEQDQYSTH